MQQITPGVVEIIVSVSNSPENLEDGQFMQKRVGCWEREREREIILVVGGETVIMVLA